MEFSCQYTEQAIADSRKGVVLQLDGGRERLTTSQGKNSIGNEMLRMVSNLTLIFWEELQYEK